MAQPSHSATPLGESPTTVIAVRLGNMLQSSTPVNMIFAVSVLRLVSMYVTRRQEGVLVMMGTLLTTYMMANVKVSHVKCSMFKLL